MCIVISVLFNGQSQKTFRLAQLKIVEGIIVLCALIKFLKSCIRIYWIKNVVECPLGKRFPVTLFSFQVHFTFQLVPVYTVFDCMLAI